MRLSNFILFFFIDLINDMLSLSVLLTGNGHTEQGTSSPAIDCETTVAKSSFSGIYAWCFYRHRGHILLLKAIYSDSYLVIRGIWGWLFV